MSSFRPLDLYLQVPAFPPSFSGTPAEIVAELVRRSRIVAPTGMLATVYTGTATPSSNVGIWVRGRRIWLWNSTTSQYEPLDVSESETKWFWLQEDTPSNTAPALWFRLRNGRLVGVYHNVDGTWYPHLGIVLSGPTADRPANPVAFQQYFDTDINVLIWWERNAWRTVSGVPGDVKFVAYETLQEALRRNPGWALFGSNNPQLRGRTITGATKDPGSDPASVFPPSPGVTARAAFEVFGDDVKLTTTTGTGAVYPTGIALWTLVKE